MKNGIYFYKDPFLEYKKHGSGKIAEYPAKETDIFGCVTFIFDQKEGFLQSEEGKNVLKRLSEHSLNIELGEKLLNRPLDDPYFSLLLNFFVFPKNDKILTELHHYQKYLLDVKKYNVISRHRTVEPPQKPKLLSFFGRMGLEFTPRYLRILYGKHAFYHPKNLLRKARIFRRCVRVRLSWRKYLQFGFYQGSF